MQRIQHIFFSVGLSLLASERIAGRNIGCFQSDDILASNAIDAAVQHGLDAIALTDFAADVAGDAVAGAAAHELQCLADLLVGKDVQIRGLPQIDGQRFLESAIEDGVGGSVYEIGNQDRIFLGERVAALEKHEADAGGDQRDDQSRDQPQGQLAASTLRRWLADGSAADGRTGGSRGQNRARFGVALEALQVGAHVGGALVAQVAVFFEQLVQDFFKLRRQVGIQAKRWRRGRFRIASKITADVSPRKGTAPVAIS